MNTIAFVLTESLLPMPEPIHHCPSLARAREWVRRPLEVVAARRLQRGIGSSTQDEIVTTNRLILITQGQLLYTIENRSQSLSAGTQLFVPAWVRRVWSVPQRVEGVGAEEAGCEIVWCEFDAADGEQHRAGMAQRSLAAAELQHELGAYRELLRLWREMFSSPSSPPSPWVQLRLEAHLKGMLARFFQAATLFDGVPSVDVHPQVRDALRWLERHFCQRDALSRLYARSGLTPNYFRRQFSAATLCTPQEYIERLRLRHARYLLRTTQWQLKRIAVEIGYDDPLYFSRLYRRFWKHPPSAERAL